MEQMYVALRFGAGGMFTQEESMPIILDEVFAAFDEKRLEAPGKESEVSDMPGHTPESAAPIPSLPL